MKEEEEERKVLGEEEGKDDDERFSKESLCWDCWKERVDEDATEE